MDKLEQASHRLLECAPFDEEELFGALAQRGEAVRDIAASPGQWQVEQLQKALEDGRRIRARLIAFYQDAQSRLNQMARVQRAEPRAHEVNCVG